MSDFSRPPQEVLTENLAEGFTGMHFMQGVPVLDRDLNLMQDLITATVRSLVSRYIGNGVPVGSDAFAVKEAPNANDFRISGDAAGPGFCLVSGVELSVPAAGTLYTAQTGLDMPPATLTTPAAGDRTDTVYLDRFLASVDTGDILDNDQDILVQTSVRLRPSWVVRVKEGGLMPTQVEPGHAYLPLATLVRKGGEPRIKAEMVIDQRPRCLTLDKALDLLFRPRIVGFSPSQGGVGAEVTVDGLNFTLLDRQPLVRFGTVLVPQNEVTVVSSSQVKAKVPGGLTTQPVKISISTAAGIAESPTTFKRV